MHKTRTSHITAAAAFCCCCCCCRCCCALLHTQSYEHILLLYVKNEVFCASPSFSLPAAGLFSCSRPRGTQGARVYTRLRFGPRPRSVARALGVQSREIWQMNHGVAFRGAKAERDHAKPTFMLFCNFCSTAVQPRSHGKTHGPSFPR